MCHSDESLPPQPPNPGPVLRHGHLQLLADDGNRIAAYEAVPETVSRGNLILLPDRRGMHPFYYQLTQNFASAGFHTVAFDFFGRTAGLGDRSDGFRWDEHGQHLRPEHVLADARAVAVHLRSAQDAPTLSVGFCMGGGHSWRLAASDLGLAGAIGLYGIPAMLEDVADKLNAPIQIHAAGADHATSLEVVEEFTQRLRDLGKTVDLHVHPGAPHAYFDEHYSEWAEACRDTWVQMLEFADRANAGTPV